MPLGGCVIKSGLLRRHFKVKKCARLTTRPELYFARENNYKFFVEHVISRDESPFFAVHSQYTFTPQEIRHISFVHIRQGLEIGGHEIKIGEMKPIFHWQF